MPGVPCHEDVVDLDHLPLVIPAVRLGPPFAVDPHRTQERVGRFDRSHRDEPVVERRAIGMVASR